MQGPVTGSSNEEQRATLASPVVRMVGLERAAELLGKGGQKEVADAIGISSRGLRYKTDGRSPIDGTDLVFTAKLLNARSAALAEHARKLREAAGVVA
ncbi:hypothetical protein SAMN05192583_0583 [Sphingomonas gellani]|uniref:Uncharacterized protein n=1 Tax=Sphingomonas gellani TaxID=1166340 RepID=A0A1H7Z9R6_9SPHN|nr:hypothetical protein [Sphingomonas gellani]SEM54744.1 hypothetical protein SAMN05192583_0583 [Sphingomonas gellani]